jgi:Trk K+ transport system NAD-binding subunit
VNDILWLTMRRMRVPLIVLLVVWGISVFGLVLIPGLDAEGKQYYLNFLEAGYFVSIMSTTVGFGEIPHDFTSAQRLWTALIIYPNVASWIYAITAILALFLDKQFQAVLARARFARSVRWSGDPFFIVCGFGDTGSMVVQGLLQRNLGAVIIEIDQDRVQRMALQPEFAHLPALVDNASRRDALLAAGLLHESCKGVITTTNDDHANLTIAITCKLLREALPVLARSETERITANMDSFNTDFIVDPYGLFAERLSLAMSSPSKYLVQDWLISVPGTELREPIKPPVGSWIICGLGRFGTRMVKKLSEVGIDFTVVDVRESRLMGHPSTVLGRGTEAHTLKEAGIENAVGLIAGTGDDVDNLSIIMTGLDLNPDLFIVARQEQKNNTVLFEAAETDLIARRSLIVARRILAIVTTPLLDPFLQHMRQQNEQWVQSLMRRLRKVLHNWAPNLWVTDLTGNNAQGLQICSEHNVRLTIGHLLRNTRSEESEQLACMCLLVERGGQRIFLPEDDEKLLAGDRLLFAGRTAARKEMLWTLSEPDRLLNYAAGITLPRGTIWRWLAARKNSA